MIPSLLSFKAHKYQNVGPTSGISNNMNHILVPTKTVINPGVGEGCLY